MIDGTAHQFFVEREDTAGRASWSRPSVDTTCTVRNLDTTAAEMQLIAHWHGRELYDGRVVAQLDRHLRLGPRGRLAARV